MRRQSAVTSVIRHKIKDHQKLADAEVSAIHYLKLGDTAHRAIKKALNL